jgi:hypothetical protein
MSVCVLDCVLDWMLTNNLRFSTAADSTQGFMEVPIWFATCRRPTGSLSAEAYFGTERGDELSMGIVKVSIPDTDHVAQMRQELPYLWWWDRCVPSLSRFQRHSGRMSAPFLDAGDPVRLDFQLTL